MFKGLACQSRLLTLSAVCIVLADGLGCGCMGCLAIAYNCLLALLGCLGVILDFFCVDFGFKAVV